MSLIASQLAEFATATSFADLDSKAVEKTEHAILDTLASLIAGVPTQNAVMSRQAARRTFGAGDSPAWFTDERLHAIGALFSNCAAASSLDVDDGHCRAAGHPGAAIVPAVLSEAIRLGSDGRQILAAVAIG